jgi:gamma-glutamyltranspeptidase/glutathione hydrolase
MTLYRLMACIVHSANVPGSIDAWHRLLADHGRKGIDVGLAPVIHYAENGYVAPDRVAFGWTNSVELLKSDEVTGRTFLPEGKATSIRVAFAGRVSTDLDLRW